MDATNNQEEEEEKKESNNEKISLLTKIYSSRMNSTLMSIAETSLNWIVGNKSDNVFWKFEIDEKKNKSNKTYIAFTVDDAPGTHLQGIFELLDFLKKMDVKVTFFIISSMIRDPKTKKINESAAKVVKRMLADGHELANHAVYDMKYINMCEEEYREAIKECEDTILIFDENFNDKDRIKWYRPPSGIMTKLHYKVLTKMNYKIAFASKFGLDVPHNVENTKYLFDFYTNNVQNGDLMVMHTPDRNINRYPLIKAFKQIITELKARKNNVQFETLSALYQRQCS